MTVIVKFFANFREITGKEQESVKGVGNISSLLNELVRKFGNKLAKQLYSPGAQELLESVNILVNGRGISFLRGLNTSLKDGDVVAIFPPVSGG